MAKPRKNEKTIVLGKGISLVGDLKQALSRCRDTSKIEVKLSIGEEKEVSFPVEHLKNLCRKLYSCLENAKTCVDMIASMEKKQNMNLIYYDRFRGFNGGARDLSQAIDNILESYPREMIQVDLES